MVSKSCPGFSGGKRAWFENWYEWSAMGHLLLPSHDSHLLKCNIYSFYSWMFFLGFQKNVIDWSLYINTLLYFILICHSTTTIHFVLLYHTMLLHCISTITMLYSILVTIVLWNYTHQIAHMEIFSAFKICSLMTLWNFLFQSSCIYSTVRSRRSANDDGMLMWGYSRDRFMRGI